MSEPAIQVRRKGKGTQVWTIEKLENRLIDMRDLYQEWKEKVPEVKKIKCKGDLDMLEAESVNDLIVRTQTHTLMCSHLTIIVLVLWTLRLKKKSKSDLERNAKLSQ